MLKMRLLRVGRKHDPSFRLIVTDSKKSPRNRAYLENLGFYDVRKGKPQLKAERIQHWISKGAQVSDTAHNLLIKAKIIKGKKIDVSGKKKRKSSPAKATEGKEEPEKKDETKT